MTPMLFFSFLLFQVKKPLFFGFFLLSALLFALGFIFLTLKL